MSRSLILASQSPRRKELLTQAGYEFQVIQPDDWAECGICSRESPPELVARLAMQKAANVAHKIESGMIVACDTVAECVGIILGKPSSRDHAREMLCRLRGRQHAVYSGLCLWEVPSQRRLIRVDRSQLRMDPVSDQEIEEYLDTNLWEGKSGAFGYQDGPTWIHLETGSASNVVGLPMDLLSQMLNEFEQLAST